MPNKNLSRLMASGMQVYPSGVSGFLSTSQRTIAGLGERGSRFGAGIPTTGAAPRPDFITGTRTAVPGLMLAARQSAWGAGRSRRPSSAAERQRNRQRFVSWMKKHQPKLYAIAKQRVGADPAAGVAGLGQETQSWFEKFTDSIQNLAPTYLQYSQQKDLMQIQLERARAGLPPLETAQYAAPAVVQVSAGPGVIREAVTTGAQQILKSPLLWVSVAGVAFLAMRK